MKYSLTILLFFASVVCKGDASFNSYFLTGRMYSVDGKPMINKEVLLIAGSLSQFCFFVTDKEGHYRVEVPYMIPCLSGPKGRTRFDDKAIAEAKYYNADSIQLYCGEEFQSIPNEWFKYYSKDTTCRERGIAFHGPYVHQECLIEKMDIHLVKKDDVGNKQESHRQEIAAWVDRVNKLCSVSLDSIIALEAYYEKRRVYDSITTIVDKMKNDSLVAKGLSPNYFSAHFAKKFPMSAYLDSISMTVRDPTWLIPYIFSKYQVVGRNINCVNDPNSLNLCNSYFTLKKGTQKNTYYISTDVRNSQYDLVFITDNRGIIQDVYEKAYRD